MKFIFSFIFMLILSANYALAACNITMFNIGHGDAVFIETDTENILVDTGNFSARSIIADKLSLKIPDKLFLSHPHADHIANAAFIVENFGVSDIFDNGIVSTSPYYLDYISSGANIHHVSAGDIIKIDDHTDFKIFHSGGNFAKLNDTSTVMLFTYKNFKMLFTGDIEIAAETALKNIGKIDVLKAPHHGSKTSSNLNFIRTIHPDTVIISADGSYNFPHAESLNSYKMAGVSDIFCTDFNGEIRITTDGYSYNISVDNPCAWIDNKIAGNRRIISATELNISDSTE